MHPIMPGTEQCACPQAILAILSTLGRGTSALQPVSTIMTPTKGSAATAAGGAAAASESAAAAASQGAEEGAAGAATATSDPAAVAKLEAFVRACSDATSIPFISWLADIEAGAPAGPEKVQLGALCGWLLAFRDLLEREGQEAMYADTLKALAGARVNVGGWLGSASGGGRLGQGGAARRA